MFKEIVSLHFLVLMLFLSCSHQFEPFDVHIVNVNVFRNKVCLTYIYTFL